MSTKSIHHRQNQKLESVRLDHDRIEQRALQIARDEGRCDISSRDRYRAKIELLAPNEATQELEIPSGMNELVSPWDAAPASVGKRAIKVLPEDEASIGKELTEKGLRIPRRLENGEDPLQRH
jgi:hypothetical protein